MTNGMTKKMTALALPLAVMALQAAAPAAVIYTEEFPNATTGNINFNSSGWAGYVGSAATDKSASPTGNAFVVANRAGKNQVAGYGAKIGTGVGLAFTTESTLTAAQRAAIQSLNLSFFSNNSAEAETYRFALRIDSSATPDITTDDIWVVTSSTYERNSTTAGSPDNFPANGELESFAYTNAAAAWNDLTFTPGTTLSLGSVRGSDLPAGGISAFGLFLDGDNTMRFDAFTVDYVAVPEPASLSLAFLGLGALLMRRRA